MKHCPACNFTFSDSYVVCDFDGTELVQDSESQSLMKAPKRLPYPRPNLKKPMLLTSLAVLGLFLSAVFIGYLESPAPSLPAIATYHETRPSPPRLTSIANNSGQLVEDKMTGAPSPTVRRRPNRSAVASTARFSRNSTTNSRSRNELSARTKDSKRTSNEKSPKVVAILKTTWKVLKKPFDF